MGGCSGTSYYCTTFFRRKLDWGIFPRISSKLHWHWQVAPKNEETWFQMDGCPAHNTLVVREYLQNAFNGHVIGQNYTIGWPARSPDLSMNDFFLWGQLKSRIYKETRYQNLEQLKNIISAACAQISPQQLSNSRMEGK